MINFNLIPSSKILALVLTNKLSVIFSPVFVNFIDPSTTVPLPETIPFLYGYLLYIELTTATFLNLKG